MQATLVRSAPGPAGAHAISGSWVQQFDSVSDNGKIVVYKATPNGLAMSTPGGESYEAKFDGKASPLRGSEEENSVRLKRIDEQTIEETRGRDGKAVIVYRLAVSADGKTLKGTFEGKEFEAAGGYVLIKR